MGGSWGDAGWERTKCAGVSRRGAVAPQEAEDFVEEIQLELIRIKG
jgi:hypothetical protein